MKGKRLFHVLLMGMRLSLVLRGERLRLFHVLLMGMMLSLVLRGERLSSLLWEAMQHNVSLSDITQAMNAAPQK